MGNFMDVQDTLIAEESKGLLNECTFSTRSIIKLYEELKAWKA